MKLTAIAMPSLCWLVYPMRAQKSPVPTLAANNCHLGLPTVFKKGLKINSPKTRETPVVLHISCQKSSSEASQGFTYRYETD